jgi:hypothetical protein
MRLVKFCGNIWLRLQLRERDPYYMREGPLRVASCHRIDAMVMFASLQCTSESRPACNCRSIERRRSSRADIPLPDSLDCTGWVSDVPVGSQGSPASGCGGRHPRGGLAVVNAADTGTAGGRKAEHPNNRGDWLQDTAAQIQMQAGPALPNDRGVISRSDDER